MVFSIQSLGEVIAGLPPAQRLLVAFSGGLDSRVLLESLVRYPQIRRGAQLEAVHVDHGLHPDSAGWTEQCRRLCRSLGVPIWLRRVVVGDDERDGIEAAARRARYAALASLVGRGDLVLTAHHRDDQAETLLLQLLRGAGPAGLGAMPRLSPLGAGWLARPLLGFSRAELQSHALSHGATWIEDPSNIDLHLARSYLRREVIPRLQTHWPRAELVLARAAEHQAESWALLQQLAHQDMAGATGTRAGTLSVCALLTLSGARRRNCLRGWLWDKGLPLPTAEQLRAVVGDVLRARPDATPRVAWRGAEVRRYRDDVYAMPPLPPHDPSTVCPWDVRGPLALDWLGLVLTAEPLLRAGIVDPEGGAVTVAFRRGGERCRVSPAGRRRRLKTLFQEAGVPPWQRPRIPLIYQGGCLVAVVGYWRCYP